MRYKDLCYSCNFADKCPVPPDTDETSRYSLLKNIEFFGLKPENSPVLTKIITECPKYTCDKTRNSYFFSTVKEITMYIDEDEIKKELKIFLNQKLKNTSRIRRFILTRVINSYIEEFFKSIKNKYPCSNSKNIKKKENYVQSNSSREKKVQGLQALIGSIGRVFKRHKIRYTKQ